MAADDLAPEKQAAPEPAGPSPSPEWERLGFYDPTSNNAPERKALLQFYESRGVRAADFEGIDPVEMAMVANRRAIRAGPRVDAETVRSHVGMDAELFDQVARAAGYGLDGRNFTQADLNTFQVFQAAADFFSHEEMLHFTGVMSSSLARVADAAAALFRIDIMPELEARGGQEMDYAQKNFEAAELVNMMTEPLWTLFVLQLELAAERGDQSRLAMDPSTDASVVKMGVGFVDLVGFTPLSLEMADAELGRFIRHFEREATNIVSSHGGRLVKLIGDEVMFVAVEANQVVDIANELMEAFTSDAIEPHGGVAHGEVVSRGGDYYGWVVNLAARIADLAVPGELLADEAAVAHATQHGFEPAGRRQLKGFPDPVRLSSFVARNRDGSAS